MTNKQFALAVITILLINITLYGLITWYTLTTLNLLLNTLQAISNHR